MFIMSKLFAVSVFISLLLQLAYSELSDEPIQLIRPNADHSNFQVVEENIEKLAEIREPVSVIAAIGPYHSGKSFLLNAFIDQPKGFKVGPSTSPETKGVWLLKTNLVGADNSRVLLLDTEGFFGSDIAEAYDAKIFAIVTLLSSHLMYNSIKIVDQQSVDYLELLARRTQLFQLRNMAAARSNISFELHDILASSNFPPLTWVVKDFSMNLKGTPNDWLYEYIRGRRDKETSGNDLDKVFENGINCHTMFLPALDHDSLEDLSKSTLSELTPEYRRDLLQLRDDILNKLTAKKTTRGPVNGATLASLLRFLVLSANENRIPQLPSLWQSWLNQQSESAIQDALSSYRREMGPIMTASLPPSESEFPKFHRRAVDHSLKLYKDLLFGNEQIYSPNLKRIEDQLEGNFKDLRDANLHHIREVINSHRNDVMKRVSEELVDIKLPMSEEEINNKFNDLRKYSNDIFEANLKPYHSSQAYQNGYQAIQDELSGKKDSLIIKNRKLVDDILNEAYRKYVASYDQDMKHTGDSLSSPLELEKIYLDAIENAKHKFDTEINKHKRFWLRNSDDYKSKLALAQQHAEDTFEETRMKYKDVIRSKADEIYNRLVDKFQRNLLEIQPFPDDEYRLADKSSDLANDLINQYNREMVNYHGSSLYMKKRDQLKSAFVDNFSDILKRNLGMIETLSGDVFRCAKNTFHQKLGDSMFGVAKYWPYSHRSLALQSANQCFALDPKANSLAPALRSKVIHDWYQNELLDERISVYNNLVKATLGSIILLIALGGLAFKVMESTEYPQAEIATWTKRRKTKGTNIIDQTPAETAEYVSVERPAPRTVKIS